MPEECFEALLAYTASSSRRPVDGLYDLAWGSFALKEIGRDYEPFLANIRSAVSMIVASDKLADVLYDYRRAVGLSLSICLFGAQKVGLHETRLDELCDVLTRNSKDSGLAELIGASFLMAKRLKRKEAERDLKKLMAGIKASCNKNPAYHIADLLSVAFFSAIVHDEFFLEALEDIKQNQYWMTYIDGDPERMAFLLYALSKAAYSKKAKGELSEWCRNQLNVVAEKLYLDLKKKRLLNSQSYIDLIDALLGVAEGFNAHVKQKFGSLIRKGEGNEIIIDREAIAPLPRVDLLAKVYIALSEAGYIRPFMLSKREIDVYRQIRAELKSYRRIRKYELIFIMATSALFMPLMLLLMLTGNITALPPVNNLLLYACIGMLIAIIELYYRQIWKRGFLSLKESLEFLSSLIKKIFKFKEARS